MPSGSDNTPGNRRRIDLDGTWRFLTDPEGTGEDAGWHEPDTGWPARSQTVEVPHAWQELDGLREYTGTAWYRRTVDVSPDALDGRDAFLRFDAVDYETTAWVNGRRVGADRGGFLPFEFGVTDALEPDENTVVVRVTDPADLAEIPHGKQGEPWYTRVSGVWGSVGLAFRPPTRVDGARVTPDLSTDTATVDVDVVTGNRTAADLRCVVRAHREGEAVATAEFTPDDGTTARLSFEDPAYWSPEDPALYDLEVCLHERTSDGDGDRDDTSAESGERLDRYTDTFGLREIETDGDEFRLNGEPLRIRGVLEQGYYPGTLYRPHEGWSFEREVETARELGFNLVRKHLKPAHPEFLAAADRQGVLVWEEPANPVRDTERSRREVREQVRGLVARDYNHPSVIVWSLYNEEWGFGHDDAEESLWTDEGKQGYLADEVAALREQDPTRLVCDNSGWAHVATDLNDYHRYFASPERASAWEQDLDHISHYPTDNYASTAFEDPTAPVVVSECGAWGLGRVDRLREEGGDPHWFDYDFLDPAFKRPAGIDERFAETTLSAAFDDLDDLAATWQARQFVAVEHVLEAMRVREGVAGYVLTQLSDVEWEFNGLLEYDREPKSYLPAFEAVNAPVTVVAEPNAHVAWAGDTLDIAVHVVNDTARARSGTIEWELGEQRGSVQASVPAHAVETVTLPPVEVATSGPVDRHELSVAFQSGAPSDDGGPSTTESITVVDRDVAAPPALTVYAEGGFAARLARAGVPVTHDLSTDVDLAFARELTDEFDRFAARGGRVVHVPSEHGRMHGEGPFSYRSLPESESWVGVAGLFYRCSPLLADVAPDRRLGWAFEDIYPTMVATDADPDRDRVHVGYVEGWLHNPASPLVVREYGDGVVAALTFRVSETYGTHPVATLLCDRLAAAPTDEP